MAAVCFRCSQPFPRKPNGASHGFGHYAALLAGRGKAGSGTVYYKGNAGGKNFGGKGGGKNAAGGKGLGGKGLGGGAKTGEKLDKLTDIVAALVATMSTPGGNKQSLTNAQAHNSQYPGLPKPGISRVGWRQPAAPSGQVAPSPPGVAAASEDTNVEVDQLAVSLASQHDISIEAATKMADVLRANKKPIPAVPRKYTAVLQEYVNNHQAANKVLLETRSALEHANHNILAAMETLEVAKNEAIQLSQDLRSAKTEAQRTWDELEEHSANSKGVSKTVQPKTSESIELSILQQVADLLSGLQRPELGPLRVQLNACMAAAIPAGEQSASSGGDPSVPPSGKLDIAMDEGPTNSKSPPIVANSDSVVVVPATVEFD